MGVDAVTLLKLRGSIRLAPFGLGDPSMNRDVVDPAEIDHDVFTLDVPDDALERTAASGEPRALTWMYCTHVWYNCGWPQ
jgi:hypothetical protein